MNKSWVIFVLSFLLLSACASRPKGYVEGNSYINTKCGYSVDFIDGWEKTTKLPSYMAKASIWGKRSLNIAFTSSAENAAIDVLCVKNSLSYDLTSISLRGSIRNSLEKQQKTMLRNKNIKSYEFSVPGAADQDYTIDAEVEDELYKMKTHIEGFTYSCDVDDTCLLEFRLISDVKTFDKNMKVLRTFISRSKFNRS